MPRELKRRGIETPIIVYTGTGTYDRCAQAVRLGTCWFIDKTERVERMGVRPKTASPEVVTRLAAYDWPKNNVRELRNCLERMMIASDDLVLRPDDVPEEIRALTTGVSPQDTVAGAATLRVLRAGPSGGARALDPRGVGRIIPSVRFPLTSHATALVGGSVSPPTETAPPRPDARR